MRYIRGFGVAVVATSRSEPEDGSVARKTRVHNHPAGLCAFPPSALPFQGLQIHLARRGRQHTALPRNRTAPSSVSTSCDGHNAMLHLPLGPNSTRCGGAAPALCCGLGLLQMASKGPSGNLEGVHGGEGGARRAGESAETKVEWSGRSIQSTAIQQESQ